MAQVSSAGLAAVSPIQYRDFLIFFDPPPIGTRVADWQWNHQDYDGPEDGRCGFSPTLERARSDIDAMIEDA